MNENIEKAKAMAAHGKAIAIDKGRNMFHVVRKTLVENWQSGIAGKVFLVSSALILLWLVVPLFRGDESYSSEEGVGRGGATPTAVLKRYYQSYFDGDLNGYMSCLDRMDEQNNDAASDIADDFKRNSAQIRQKP